MIFLPVRFHEHLAPRMHTSLTINSTPMTTAKTIHTVTAGRGMRIMRQVLLVLVILLSQATPAQLTFTNDGQSATVTGYFGQNAPAEITIPATFNGLPVVNIGEAAFAGQYTFKQVNIPASVTNISRLAFTGCSGLPSITIPPTVQSIADRAFFGCNSLTTVTLSDGLQRIGEEAFASSMVLSEVIIPNSVRSMGPGVFYGCDQLKHAVLPDSMAAIPDSTFAYCNSLTTFTIRSEEHTS